MGYSKCINFDQSYVSCPVTSSRLLERISKTNIWPPKCLLYFTTAQLITVNERVQLQFTILYRLKFSRGITMQSNRYYNLRQLVQFTTEQSGIFILSKTFYLTSVSTDEDYRKRNILIFKAK